MKSSEWGYILKIMRFRNIMLAQVEFPSKNRASGYPVMPHLPCM